MALRFETIDRSNGCFQLAFTGTVNGIEIHGRTLTVFPQLDGDPEYAARVVTPGSRIHRVDGSGKRVSTSIHRVVMASVKEELQRRQAES